MMLRLIEKPWRMLLNKSILIILFFSIYQLTFSINLRIDNHSKLDEINYDLNYERVEIKNLCLKKSNFPRKIVAESIDFDKCLIKCDELNSIIEYKSLEKFVISNSILLDDYLDLTNATLNLKLVLDNIQSKIKILGLKNLTSCMIKNSSYVELDINDFSQNLKILLFESINYKGISNFDSINNLDRLQELTIIGYEGQFQISNLNNLKFLWLSNLRYFPKISALSKLENLSIQNIHHYELSDIKRIIDSNRRTLISIWLTDLRIKNIPSEIYNCKELETLVLDRNFIDTIDSSILSLKKLIYFSLESNNIKILDTKLFNLDNLKELNIEKNNIENINEIKNINSKIYIHYDEKYINQLK